jgi:hypothetical protein
VKEEVVNTLVSAVGLARMVCSGGSALSYGVS